MVPFFVPFCIQRFSGCLEGASVKTVSGPDVTICHLGSSPRAGACYRR
ncbi:hypothetical protein C8D78_0086 [Arthrobacter oryzae]|uniref:Uncharacterized protein n=1 Tax=Arthrobacter oryzae TaxID=409290 RepID=A0A495FM32_9MICC|nr:hypothetical protein C8D78_0086 [Arthrobacter oryzae]